MSPFSAARRAVFPAYSWPVWVAGVLGWAMLMAVAMLWWWLPAQTFEVVLSPPVAINPATGLDRARWKRGETLAVRWHTRILRDCPVLYERWLRRADGLSYGPAHLGSHSGHYRRDDSPEGRHFIASLTLPEDMQPGQYAYRVRAISRCSPLRPRIDESPSVLIEVR